MKFRVSDVVDQTGALLWQGSLDRELRGVSTDTRSLEPGDLFVALQGPNFDGNRFAEQAVARGAAALCLRRAPEGEGEGRGEPAGSAPELARELPIVLHRDPRRALADLASWHRSQLACAVIGITGSCGKTTTKNILLELLASQCTVQGSPSSFNNDIGVPLTVLGTALATEVLVVELGTNQPGEIARLARIARPTAGIVTNVGASHLEGLGSVEGVAREKSDLLAGLPPEGFCVFGDDGQYADLLRDSTAARPITFSVEGEGELNATAPWFHAGGTTFELDGYEVTSPLLGLHNIHNLLAALAACRGLGVALADVLPAVSRLTPGRQRMERVRLGGLELFDDTYNANPDSARAGVRVLAGLHGYARRVLVLGDMLELGPGAPEIHHAFGREAAEAGIDLAVFIGDLARAAAAGALDGGMEPARVVHLEDVERAIETLPGLVREGDSVLIKGSRRLGLERVVANLRAHHADEPEPGQVP